MKSNKDRRKSVENQLAEDHACYVLVTCEAPKENGEMEVEVSYQGSPVLASYLLESAQAYMDEQVESEVEMAYLSDNYQND